MTHHLTDKLLDAIQDMLKQHGIRDYCVAIADPDTNHDVTRFGGSVWWRLGLAHVLMRQAEDEVHDTQEVDDATE